MTHGTSAHGASLSSRWTDAGQERAGFGWQQVAGEAAPLQLLALSVVAGLALGLTLTNATDSALHTAVLTAVGALALCVALRPRQPAEPAQQDDRCTPDEPSQLLAQMQHELRTPLNAMIGFSEVMLHELHGPLGNARYQEYAAHISESGGRLLKASEDALAIAATMSALMADRRVLRREQLPAAALVREAWTALDTRGRDLMVEAAEGAPIEIACDRQATGQALRQLLSEAAAHTPPGDTVVVRQSCAGGPRCVELTVVAPGPGSDHQPAQRRGDARAVPGNGLRLILARSLLEMQGATLSLDAEPRSGRWAAHIAFPAAPVEQLRRRRPPVSASARRWPAFPAHPGGFATGAAARASAGSPAAPPA
jgi:signal transduction histidine kinase